MLLPGFFNNSSLKVDGYCAIAPNNLSGSFKCSFECNYILKAGVKFCVISNLAAGNYNLLQV